jgi:hypothetical protein
VKGVKMSNESVDKLVEKMEEKIRIKKFLEGRVDRTFEIVNGVVNVEGSVDLSKQKLTSFEGIQFGVVTGNFYCYDNKLTSLEGSPKKISGGFNCSNNKLTSLEGSPREVGEDFNCFDNELTSLEGSPEKVGEGFNCYDNELTSLEGSPEKVGEGFNCEDNLLLPDPSILKCKVGGKIFADIKIKVKKI